jgi:hypothetical protein
MRRNAIELFNNRYEISRVARSLIQTVTPFLRAFPSNAPHEVIPPKPTARVSGRALH